MKDEAGKQVDGAAVKKISDAVKKALVSFINDGEEVPAWNHPIDL